jgi:hypothetical protein
MFDYDGYYYINDDSGFYSRSEVLGSHTEHNPICSSIKVFTETRLGLDYNSPWGEALTFLKLKFRFFEKKMQTIFITI